MHVAITTEYPLGHVLGALPLVGSHARRPGARQIEHGLFCLFPIIIGRFSCVHGVAECTQRVVKTGDRRLNLAS
ncbi:hypothetical protein D3C72_1983040 [compost metagenome]